MLLGWDFSYEREGKIYRTYVSSGLIEQVNYPILMDKVIDARDRRSDPVVNNLFLPRVAEPSPRPPARPTLVDGERRQGTVVNLPSDKPYGFIKPAGGGDNLFFHATDTVDVEFRSLSVQDRVLFTMVTGERGPVARSVQLDPAPQE